MSHYKERQATFAKRLHDDDSDDLALCIGTVSWSSLEPDEPEVDELGRTIRRVDESGPYSGVRRQRRQDRLARRASRRTRRPIPVDHEDGFSTDSSLGPGDAEDYEMALDSLRTRVKALEDDIKAEDFIHPQLGLAVRFGGWRERYPEEYNNAYGGLAMVQGWEYWARKEMVGWEPGRSSKTLDEFAWFDQLSRYSRPTAAREDDGMNSEDDDEPPLGADGDLAAAMISSTVTHLIQQSVEAGVYDVYSTQQTRSLADLVDVIGEYIGKDGLKYRVS